MNSGFSNPKIDTEPEDRPTISYKPGDIVEVVLKDIPSQVDTLPNGLPKLPVGFVADSNGRFVVVIKNLPNGMQVGDRLRVTLLKVTRSYGHRAMAFGVCVK